MTTYSIIIVMKSVILIQVVNMARQIGSVLGTTLLVIAMSRSSVAGLAIFRGGWWIAVVLLLLGAVAALSLPKKSAKAQA